MFNKGSSYHFYQGHFRSKRSDYCKLKLDGLHRDHPSVWAISNAAGLISGQILWPSKIMYVYLLAGPHKKTGTENCPRFTWSDSAQRRWIVKVHVKIYHPKS